MDSIVDSIRIERGDESERKQPTTYTIGTMTRHRPTLCLALMLAVCWSSIALLATPSRAADSYEDDYVREVIEEDQQNYNNHNDYYTTEEDYQKQQQAQAEAEQRRWAEEEQKARDTNDREAADRERRFRADLLTIDDEEQRKLALKQKRKDGRRVRSVLRAAKKEDWYGVIGLRKWSLRIPPRSVNIAGVVKFTVPGITLVGEPTAQDIKKQFRQRAMQVHPDKNRDGRAGEAFVAVQNAAGILSDPSLRSRYDAERKARRSEALDSSKQLAASSLVSVWAVVQKVRMVVQTLLGPFFVPVVIVGALII